MSHNSGLQRELPDAAKGTEGDGGAPGTVTTALSTAAPRNFDASSASLRSTWRRAREGAGIMAGTMPRRRRRWQREVSATAPPPPRLSGNLLGAEALLDRGGLDLDVPGHVLHDMERNALCGGGGERDEDSEVRGLRATKQGARKRGRTGRTFDSSFTSSIRRPMNRFTEKNVFSGLTTA